MHAEGKQHALHAVLNEQVQCSGQLLACLETERSALTRRDMETVERTTAEKLQLSQQLEQLEHRRASLVAELGFGTDTNSPGNCFDSMPQAPVFNRLWRQILTNLEACRTGNLTTVMAPARLVYHNQYGNRRVICRRKPDK